MRIRSAVALGTALGCLLGGATMAADRGRIRFRVVNASPHVIRQVYVCPSTQSSWGPNLTEAPVKPGRRAILSFPGACGTYDVRLVADNGIEFLQEELEFCDDDDVVTIGGDRLTRHRQRRGR